MKTTDVRERTIAGHARHIVPLKLPAYRTDYSTTVSHLMN